MTIASMTGFARQSGEHADWAWAWEIKSVNAKGLDIRLRAPSFLDALEPAARNAIARKLKRGNVTVNLTLRRSASSDAYHINEAHLKTIMAAARRLAAEAPDLQPASVHGILGLRGVIDALEEDVGDKDREVLEKALLTDLGQAVDALIDVRVSEGAHLVAALGGFLDTLEALHGQAAGIAADHPEMFKQRLLDQIAQVADDISALDPGRLEQEVAILASKADIREELDRLHAHLATARDLLGGGGAVGRRLDFLCQELNREANTICSKAHDRALTTVGLELKAVIEQFREQVQNIE